VWEEREGRERDKWCRREQGEREGGREGEGERRREITGVASSWGERGCL